VEATGKRERERERTCSETPSVYVLLLMNETKFHTHAKQAELLMYTYLSLYVIR
jgi:hypothetical protein